MDWKSFLSHVKNNSTSPVLRSILNKTTFIENSESKVIASCENLGTKLFLDGKKQEIEKHLSSFLNRTVSVVFVIKEKKRKKDRPLPLITYQDSFTRLLDKAGLLSRFTFKNFAVSQTNQIAHAAAQAISESPGTQYNPLFLYGGVGVGKTHLMQAIGASVLKNGRAEKILYCTSEDFTNALIEKIRARNTAIFRKRFRDLQLLMVDDVQFIAGKNHIQEEFYHTFNSIIARGGQIILASDKPPKEINKLEDRLRSRFSGGLIIDIQKPDFELRTAILLIKAKERKIEIEIEAAKEVAENIKDTRELEGMLLNIYSKMVAQQNINTITLSSVKEVEKNESKKITQRINPTSVIKNVCLFYQLKPSQIKGKGRKNKVALARQIIMYIIRTRLEMKLEEIAFILKRKDHTTIIHGVDKIRKKAMKDKTFKEELDSIIDSL